MAEEWRPVVGHEEAYEVSNLGRVKSLDRRVPVRKDQSITRFAPGKVLNPQPDSHGHLRIYLAGRTRSVHRLVAEAFIPNPEGLPNVLHWNDIPDDNRVENLRWGTQQDNIADIVRNGNHFWANRAHCKNGHEFSDENTYTPKSRPGARDCKKCINLRQSQNLDKKDTRHGTYAGYTAGCRCGLCREAKREYSRNYWRSKHGKGLMYRD